MFESRSKQLPAVPVIETLEERRLLSADLAPVFSSHMPAQFTKGNTNHVVVDVLNIGDSTATGPVGVDLFASPTNGSDETLLGTFSRRVNLKTGREAPMNIRFAEPMGLADGNYELVAQISTSALMNATSANDIVTSANPITLTKPRAEVAVKTVTAPTQAIIVENNYVQPRPASVTITNRAAVIASGGVTVNFYLSSSKTLDASAVPAGSITSAAINLAPGRSTTLETLIGTQRLPTGSYNLFAVVTPTGGNLQNNAHDRVARAGQKVQIQVVLITTSNPPASTYIASPVVTGGSTNYATANQASGNATQSCANSSQACNNSNPSCDDGSQACNDTGASCDNSGQSCDDGGQTCDSSDASCDNSGQQDDGADQTDDSAPQSDNCQQDTSSPDNSGQQADAAPTDSSSDNTTDDSAAQDDSSNNDGSPDDSAPQDDSSSSDDSGSVDDSGSTDDSGSDDSSSYDDSGSTDDSGDDTSEGDFIARRSAQSIAAKTKAAAKAKPAVHAVVKVAGSTTSSHTAGYRKVTPIHSGGHR